MFQANVIGVRLTPSQGLDAQETAVFVKDWKVARTKARSHAWNAAPERAPPSSSPNCPITLISPRTKLDYPFFQSEMDFREAEKRPHLATCQSLMLA